ncbi:LysR family transcriptional regulator [Psychromicrobium xiongbiense]|uniref:LysR family transcriptional regulator n=1 Tax=Psychromicrobium xiongbiense TaxID=3051184 RepID=UPI0025554AA3|nr:LysR family transcriptional regulator [Psychromicrobium sp. YIM S02556]
MEVHQLELLRELGELGSVTAVANRLFVTPSAVSQQLAQLQRGVGIPLTRKEGRALVLTDAGRVLAEAGGRVVQAMAEARVAVKTHLDDPLGVVSVCAFHSAGQALFGPLAAALHTGDGPGLRMADEDVAEADFAPLTGQYDLVLAHRMSHSSHWAAASPTTASLVATTLLEEPFDIAVHAGDPLAARTSLTPQEVASRSWVRAHQGFSPSDILDAVAVVAGQPVDVAHRVNDYATVAALVAAGGVIGLMPRYLRAATLPDGVVLRPLRGVKATRRIDVLSRPENLARRSVRTVIETLHSVTGTLMASHDLAAQEAAS